LRFEVAGHLIIAVRRTDGQISQCGVTRQRMGRPFVAG
jgi:hypothetical protein